MSGPEESTPPEQAEEALALLSRDPRASLEIAEALLQEDLDADTRALATRAAGLAEFELGRVASARSRLEDGRDSAIAQGVPARAVEIQIGLAIVLLQCDEPLAALAEVESALGQASDQATRGRVQAQRSMILMRLGRTEEALEASDAALADCRATGADLSVARLLANRGVLHGYLGHYEKADAELNEALVILRRLGSELLAAQVEHNLGFVAGRRGDIPLALSRFESALEKFERLGVPSGAAFVDLCEVLTNARLLPEAMQAAETAVCSLSASEHSADLAEARLRFAEVALASGDNDTARREAEAAAVAFKRQARTAWAVLAKAIVARTGWAGSGGLTVAEEAIVTAEELERAGWAAAALEARITSATEALACGQAEVARRALATVGASTPADDVETTLPERSRNLYAAALRRLAEGHESAALEGLRASCVAAEQYRASLGATELRARAASGTVGPADLGLRLALASGDPARAFEWSERRRAGALWQPAVRPPADPELARLLTDLRHNSASAEHCVANGEDGRALRAERLGLESAIRRCSLRESAVAIGSAGPPRLEDVRASLADKALVEFAEIDGRLHAVVCRTDSVSVVHLTDSAVVAREVAALRFALGRLASGLGTFGSLLAMAQLLRRSADRAGDILFGPLADQLTGAGGVVVVPTGGLHALPWSLLPALRDVPVVAVPSAAVWLRTSTRERGSASPGRVVCAAGPGIRWASEELALVAACHAGATVLSDDSASVAGVMEAGSGASVLHLIAHGSFRADNPLFSSLALADGPLTVYDLERLPSPPDALVLSACDAGRSDVHPGDGLMGTTAAMLAMGTSSVVASVLPIPDAGATRIMGDLHARLASGDSPECALLAVRGRHPLHELSAEETASRSPEALQAIAVSMLVAFGAGRGRGSASLALATGRLARRLN